MPDFYHTLAKARVIIIGNGPSALEGNHGDTIDRFDAVIRINNYVIEGLETHVGSRTDIWVNGANQGLKKRTNIPDNILVMIPPEVLRHKGDAIHARINKRLGTSDYVMLPLETMVELETSSGLQRPTTGFFAIYFFHKLGFDITLHGFDFFTGSKGHYFDHPITSWLKDNGIIKKATKHDLSGEKAFIEGLIEAGMLRRLEP